VAVNPTTNPIYVAMPLLGLVGVINGATNKLIATIQISSAPVDAAVNTNNRRVYVTDYGGQEVDVIGGKNN
jgi:YVTN family beta-propeller protein